MESCGRLFEKLPPRHLWLPQKTGELTQLELANNTLIDEHFGNFSRGVYVYIHVCISMSLIYLDKPQVTCTCHPLFICWTALISVPGLWKLRALKIKENWSTHLKCLCKLPNYALNVELSFLAFCPKVGFLKVMFFFLNFPAFVLPLLFSSRFCHWARGSTRCISAYAQKAPSTRWLCLR